MPAYDQAGLVFTIAFFAIFLVVSNWKTLFRRRRGRSDISSEGS